MKVSARNIFRGKVAATRPGTVNAEVDIDLGGGDHLTAVVTLTSLKELGLSTGCAVIALVKAPWVMVLTDASGVKLSARNKLAGTVKAVEVGAVNAEVCIALPGGTEVMAVITRDAVNELGLKAGVAATAVIKASHVVLGVPA
ncbi:TOBE domain-containing protein [Pseudothauera lacus]|uniref:Transporter n=1 Tax=Pseudothauera lacus TaxID=2136175 RepID=A0A2T4IIZ1_9RHOO|nr:TOBE domain-containing protein [Pseudothauera lacus]PTD97735.1 transporter [Pseudothauera lacus]